MTNKELLQWEYISKPLCHIKTIPYKYPFEIMREAGAEGWEAICIHEVYIYFKRPKALASQQTMRKYFFAQDDSCHWYMIPVERREEWNNAGNLNLDSDEGYAAWQKGNWDDYRTGGGIEDIEFSVDESPAPIQ